MPLEDYYASDEGFHHFATVCGEEWASCDCQAELLERVGGDLDVAMVLHYHFLKRALGVLSEKVPALEGLTMTECLKLDKGRRRLKEFLWRMP